MEEISEVKVKLLRIMGSKSPFWQTGSFRITLPKSLIRKYAHLGPRQPITQGCNLEEVSFVFIETDKGILLRPLSEVLEDPDMKGLTFAPVHGLSLKEISKIIDESAEKDES